MNYEQALEYIHGIKRYATKPGLERIQNLLRDMGDPQKKTSFVHVAGTNGKGSTIAMCASVMSHAGYRTGSFISPFLERFNERIQVEGQPIADDDLVELTKYTKEIADSMLERGLAHPTEFELVTAMAFKHWANTGCDTVALEVGMGGRLDATNVIDAPAVAIIATIALDHTHYLGDTLTEIAYEKCGIIKPGCPVVCYAEQSDEAKTVIERICRMRGCEFIQPDASAVEIIESGAFGTRFRYKGIETTVPLMGRHQVINSLSVIEAMRALGRSGYHITDEDIAKGIAETQWVGRLEPVHDDPYCVIDAAHNPEAVRVLAQAADSLFADKKIITVMGMLADKDYEFCIPEIAKRSYRVITTTPTSGRALPAEESAAVARQWCDNVECIDDICDAVDHAFATAKEGEMILVCGSLYVIGIAKTHIREKYGK